MKRNSTDNLSAAYHSGMDRRALLRALIDERYGGNVAAFARAIKKAPAQVHQWLSGHRNLGDAGARHIERTVPGLWQGYFDGERKPDWLDHDHTAPAPNTEPGPPAQARSIGEVLDQLRERLRAAPAEVRQEVNQLVMRYMESDDEDSASRLLRAIEALLDEHDGHSTTR